MTNDTDFKLAVETWNTSLKDYREFLVKEQHRITEILDILEKGDEKATWKAMTCWRSAKDWSNNKATGNALTDANKLSDLLVSRAYQEHSTDC